MGWVTLSLRRMEDHCLVNNLELQLIGLSRRRMQLLRGKNKQRTELNSQKAADLKALKEGSYSTAKDNYKSALNSQQEAQSNGGTADQDVKDAVSNAAQQYAIEQSDYNDKKEEIKNNYDQELQDLEEETTEAENELDMEQAEIEAELEAVRGELEAVKQQISSDVQSTTIKLG